MVGDKMNPEEDPIQHAVMNTEVLRPPRQTLATFGATVIRYFLITEPVYEELVGLGKETVIRNGRVTVQRPQVVTPNYLFSLFQGFEHGQQFAEHLVNTYGPNEPGLVYQYRNEPGELNIVSEPLPAVADKLRQDLERQEDHLAAIIKGIDQLWDISLMKFIHDLTVDSVRTNVEELVSRGLLDVDRQGVPRDVRERLEQLFEAVRGGNADPTELKVELDRWGLFQQYQDRFLALFRRR